MIVKIRLRRYENVLLLDAGTGMCTYKVGPYCEYKCYSQPYWHCMQIDVGFLQLLIFCNTLSFLLDSPALPNQFPRYKQIIDSYKWIAL